VFDLTGSASDLGFVIAARFVPLVALLLVGGVWADRIPRNVVLLSTDVVRFALQTAVGVLLITGEAKLWHIAVAMVLDGAAQAFFMPASTGIVPHTVPPGRLQQANGLLGMTTSSLNMLGPAIAGGLVATVGPGWAFVVDGATFLLSAAFLARMRLPRAAHEATVPKFLDELKHGWREFRAQTWMVIIDVWAIVANMTVIAAWIVLGPLVAEEELNGAGSWGIMLAGFGLGAVLGDLVAVVTRPRRPLVLGCIVMAGWSVPLLLLAIPAPTLVIAAGAAFAGGGLTLFNTLFATTMQEQVPDEALSRVAAYDWLASVAFMPIGFAIVGPISEAIGVAEVLTLFAVLHLALGAVILSLPVVRRIERRGTAAAGPVSVPVGVPVAAAPPADDQ
jgi:MFS family permease